VIARAIATRLAVLICALPLAGVAAQSRPLFPEARVDGISARASAAFVGAGLAIPLTTYTRIALVAGGGQSWYRGERGGAARVELVGRFVLDPLRERRWAPYGLAGLGALYHALDDARDRWREVIVIGVGVEGPALGAVAPAVEIGVGGGARLSVVLRRALPNRR
jgi:hypothetical protein